MRPVKKTRPKISFLMARQLGGVTCPKCWQFIQRGPKSNADDAKFIRTHQLRSSSCVLVEPGEEEAEVDFFEPMIEADDDDDDDRFANVIARASDDMEFEFDAWEDIEEEEAMDQEQLPEWDFKINMGILKKQDAFIDLFDNGKIVEKFRKIRTPSGGRAKTDWRDLFAIYSLGAEFGFSRAKGNRLLKEITDMLKRHNISKAITLRKDWRSMQKLFTNGYAGLFNIRKVHYNLPSRFFGIKSLDGRKPIAKFSGVSLDVIAVLAEALLEIDPENFSTSHHRDGDILAGYETGEDFKNICADTDQIGAHPKYGKPIPLCIGLSSDKTQCNTSGSVCEQAVVLSILNAKKEAYKMLFSGFLPLELPYSDRILDGLLAKQGRVLLSC